jgi:ABC-type antimicrobial peptide transport system ATPase subunit
MRINFYELRLHVSANIDFIMVNNSRNVYSHCVSVNKGNSTLYRVIQSPSGISDLCGTVAGMVTPKGSMLTEGETLQFSVLPYRFSICPLFVTRQMSIL